VTQVEKSQAGVVNETRKRARYEREQAVFCARRKDMREAMSRGVIWRRARGERREAAGSSSVKNPKKRRRRRRGNGGAARALDSAQRRKIALAHQEGAAQ